MSNFKVYTSFNTFASNCYFYLKSPKWKWKFEPSPWSHPHSDHIINMRPVPQNLTYRPSTATSRWFSAKWRQFRVTSGDVRSCDIISCHVTASPRELQPCRSSNVHKTWLIDLLQPLPSEFRSSDVTDGWLPAPWRHVTSFPVTWLPPPECYSLVAAQTYPKLDL